MVSYRKFCDETVFMRKEEGEMKEKQKLTGNAAISKLVEEGELRREDAMFVTEATYEEKKIKRRFPFSVKISVKKSNVEIDKRR